MSHSGQRCAGCTNKYGYFEHPRLCPECRKQFCQTCLPHLTPESKKKKKSGEPLFSVNPCVYCISQKGANKAEDAEILEKFHERFYKHTHTEPAIQSRIDHDLSKGLPATDNSSSPQISKETKALEDRLKELKGTRVPESVATVSDISDKLADLRGESPAEESSQLPQFGNDTQFGQAQNLIEQAANEVKLDEKMDQVRARKLKDLENRLGELKGIKGKDTESPSTKVDIKTDPFFDDFDIEIPDDDPELLLSDLKKISLMEEKAVLEEVGQDDIQGLLNKAKELAKEEKEELTQDSELTVITYPDLDKIDVQKEQQEATKLVSDVLKEIESEKDTELTSQEEDGDIVKSKLDHPQLDLNVSWDHFGPPDQGAKSHDTEPSAARQLGISSNEDDPELKMLIDKTKAEAELDNKVEASGFSFNTKPKQTQSEAAGASRSWPPALGEDGEYPWCCICNCDATIRCHDCDDDLYCTRCFSEGHEQFGLFDHKYSPFEPNRR